MSQNPLAMADNPQPSRDPSQPTRLTNWKHEPDLATLSQDVFNARQHQNAHIAKVNTWLDNLNCTGSAKYIAPKGRSGVQPKLIRKHAEWRYADLSEPFLSAEKIFTISPRTFEDKAAAEQNELVINWQIDTKLNKVALIDHLVRTATDEGTVILRTGWDRAVKEELVEVPEYGYFPIRDPRGMQAMEQQIQALQQNPNALVQLHPEVQESVKYSMERQAPFRAKILRMVKVPKQKVVKNQPVLEIANIFNLVVDPTCGTDYDKAMFMAYSIEMSAGELQRDKRYTNLDRVDWGRSPLAEPDHVRTTNGRLDDFNFSDKSRKKVVVQEYWGYFDIDGTGHLTPIVMAWIGSTVIRLELNPFPDGKPPFVIIPLLPIRNSFYGEPDGELLADNQKIIGAVTRGMIDILARSANAQRGMAKSMLDVVNKRRYDAGQDYEYNPNVHPSQGIHDHKFPELPQSAPLMVQAMNFEAESLTGVKTYGDQGLSGASLGPTAAGAKGVLNAASRRTTGIVRRIAMGLSQAGRKIVAMNQEFLSEEEVVRVTNEQFVTVKREDLAGDFDLKVEITSAEEDEAKSQQLAFMLQTLGPNGDGGMTKLILSEIAKLRRMPTLAHMIKNFEPKPDPLQQRKVEAEVRKLEAEALDLEASAMERQAKAKKAMADAEKALADARLTGAVADKTDLDFVNDQTGVTHNRKLSEMAAQARGNTEHSITEAILNRRNGKDADGKVDTSPTNQDIEEAIRYNAAGQSPVSLS